MLLPELAVRGTAGQGVPASAARSWQCDRVIAEFEYVVWFQDPSVTRDDEDFEWPALFVVSAVSAGQARYWGMSFYATSQVGLANGSFGR